jgi:hypothetical protein
MTVRAEYEIIETASGEFGIAQRLETPPGAQSGEAVSLMREYPTRAEAQAQIDRLNSDE